MNPPNIVALPAQQGKMPRNQPLLRKTEELCTLFRQMTLEAIDRIEQAEKEAIARLENFIPTEPLMTAPQVAAYLGFDTRTIHKWTKPGKEPAIPYVLIGGEKRFRKSSIDRELERGTIQRKQVKL